MNYYSKRILVCLWSPPRLSQPLRPCFRFSLARFSQQPWRRSDKSFPAFQGSSTSHVVWIYRADAWYESADLLQFLVFEKERVKWWLKKKKIKSSVDASFHRLKPCSFGFPSVTQQSERRACTRGSILDGRSPLVLSRVKLKKKTHKKQHCLTR